MALYITSLNSGSNGNCYYVGNDKEAILVDVGISCREVQKRMTRLGLDLKKVKAIFISHEHSDHIKGVEVLSKKYSIPVYISQGTFKNSGLFLQQGLPNNIMNEQSITIGELKITPFKKFHDAADPYSFTVESNNITVGVFTDLGKACDNLVKYFKSCHAAFLEANYDETMLMEGNYPYHLKRRISSDVGHLSNTQALQLFLDHKPEFMTHVFLSHLSRENNSPALVQKLFEQHCGTIKVVVASRDYETDLFTIENSDKGLNKEMIRKDEQLVLF